MSGFLLCTIFLTWQTSLPHPSPRHPHQHFCWFVRLSLLYDLVVRDTLLVKLVVGRALLTDGIVHSTLLVDEVVLGALCETRRHSLIDRLCSSIVLVVVSVFGLITLFNNFCISVSMSG